MNETAEFNQGYFNIIRNRYPNAEYGLKDNEQLTAFDNGKPVGAIMAIRPRGNVHKPSCYTMAREMGYIE